MKFLTWHNGDFKKIIQLIALNIHEKISLKKEELHNILSSLKFLLHK